MKKMLSFLKDENGQGMVEYGLLVGLIAIVVVVALLVLGPVIANMFDNVSNQLQKTPG
ncbi:MAG: Flp family type IVb pilin [Eubacterium sp.]